MQTVRFHGTHVALDYPPLPGDAYTRLFAPFPSSDAAPTLRVQLTQSPLPVRRPFGSNWAPCFCYGLAQVYLGRDAYAVHAENSWLHCETNARTIRGILFAHATSAGVVRGMQHIALSLMLRELGMFELHAAGLVTPNERGLILLGDAGAGKTTALLAFMEAGARYLGDDRILLQAADHGPEMLGYPRDFHLTRRTLSHFSKLAPFAGLNEDSSGKRSVEPCVAFPGLFRERYSGPLTLVLCRVEDHAESTLRGLSAADAFGQLLGSSAILAVRGVRHGEIQLQLLKALVENGRAYTLSLGKDLLARPQQTATRLLSQV